MSTYSIEVTFTPLCSSCGKELDSVMTQSRVTGEPFVRDNPHERKDRRVFVSACTDCFTFTGGKAGKELTA